MKFSVSRRVLCSLGLITLIQPALFAAGDFSITSGTNTTAQSLTGGSGSTTGSVSSGATLSLSGSTVAVTINGTSSLTNNGTIRQTGSGRAIDSNTGSNSVLSITNTGTISSVSTDAFRVNTDSQVTLNNSGTISVSNGGQAIDWAAITSKANTLNNLSGGAISAFGEDAVRPGTNGAVNNAGTITATVPAAASPVGADGIDIRTFSGVVVTNTGTISGRHGIATDGSNNPSAPWTFKLDNNAGTISAINGSGLNIDGVTANITATVTNAQGATIKGGVMSAATEGDGDGIDVDGVLNLTNSGDVLGLGAKGPNNPEGVAMGGGTITNTATGRIIGSSSATDAPNGDSSKIGSGILVDDSNGGNAIAATTITNSGLIQGKSGSAIKMIGNFSNTITNNSTGTIQGAGDATAVGAAIQTGNGNDTVSNAGTITGENGKAIDLQGGNDSLQLKGGSVSGSIDGGSGTNTLTVNTGTSSTNGSVTNFSNATVQGGRWNHSGSIDNGTAISITGGILNYTGAGALNNTITVNGGEFKNNGGNLTGTLNFVSGTVSGNNLSGVALTIAANQVLSPGNSPGTMTTGNETWASGGTYIWEINALAANGGSQGSNPGWDFASITGTLDITATSGNRFLVDIDSLNVLSSWNSNQDYDFIIATASGGISGFDASDFTLTSTAFSDQNSLNGGLFSIRQNGNNVELHFQAAPEPSTWALITLGLAALGWTRLRRSKKI